jgi:hypothetical protein
MATAIPSPTTPLTPARHPAALPCRPTPPATTTTAGRRALLAGGRPTPLGI